MKRPSSQLHRAAILDSPDPCARRGLIKGVTASIVVGEWKLIDRRSRKESETQLYRWPADPAEDRDLASAFPVRVAALRALRAEKLASPQTRREAEEAALDPELEQRLRAFGYL
ncbi:MAG: hypothetical protein OEM62_06985 [Acidobacteriota bacterium]|nr:hypothetical protein [Acidobacteriota bacterium]